MFLVLGINGPKTLEEIDFSITHTLIEGSIVIKDNGGVIPHRIHVS